MQNYPKIRGRAIPSFQYFPTLPEYSAGIYIYRVFLRSHIVRPFRHPIFAPSDFFVMRITTLKKIITFAPVKVLVRQSGQDEKGIR